MLIFSLVLIFIPPAEISNVVILCGVLSQFKLKSSTNFIARTVDRLEKGETVVVISSENGISRVRTPRGKIGYIKTNKLDDEFTVREALAEEKQIDGKVNEVMNVYPIDKKFESFGFATINVDGHNIEELIRAFDAAKKTKGKPTAIIAKTIKGKGVDFMENQAGWHGKAPNEDEYNRAINYINK